MADADTGGVAPIIPWAPPLPPPPRRGVAVLGASGSIGRQALEVIDRWPDLLELVAVTVHRDTAALGAFARRGVRFLGITGGGGHDLPARAAVGPSCLEEAVIQPGVDLVVAATPGFSGLRACLAALRAGRTVALANKETLVAAGDLVRRAMAEGGGAILPVDSEHVALHQCLRGEEERAVDRLWLTASGGPFRTADRAALAAVTAAEALRHPTWRMGDLVTVNSATLMNKGLEEIEAHVLFGLPYERIGVVIHPESVVHSMVEYVDGSVIAQMAVPDMRLPIQYALLYPKRLPSLAARLPLAGTMRLTFEPPRYDAFPCLSLAEAAGKMGGTATAVLNAANEVAVAGFLAGRVRFPEIADTVRATLEAADRMVEPDVAAVEAADAWARRFARERVGMAP
jgi:1-deoxy-D-xylulose-5-phosphate reductoisomerase